MTILGHKVYGNGPQRVLILHDWMGDHRNYETMLPYLNYSKFTYVFADLRGYGLSKELHGSHQLEEAAGDVLTLANDLGWIRFHLVGHSMSSLVVQQAAHNSPESIASLVLLTPLGPAGMDLPSSVVSFLEDIALHEDQRRSGLSAQWGDRLWPGWMKFKMQRWSESARPEVIRDYVSMFASTSVQGPAITNRPVLAVVGGCDAEPFVPETVRDTLSKAYSRLQVSTIPNVGHYPMQESPVALASIMERFFEAWTTG